MSQICYSIRTHKRQAETYYQTLEDAFFDDAYPLALNEAEKDSELFDVSLYVDQERDKEVYTKILELLDLDKAQLNRDVLADIDWVAHSLEHLKPIRCGNFFIHGSHDRDKIKEGDHSIEIDAGRAFGTGHHGTTAACLMLLQNVLLKEKPNKILDLGTGSAILAIAAAKLHQTKILATDNDPIAVQTAYENIRLNNVEDQVETFEATGFHHEKLLQEAPFDLIIANILANPLIALAGDMKKYISSSGSLILSGILAEQGDKLCTIYEQYSFVVEEKIFLEGWVSFHLKHKQ